MNEIDERGEMNVTWLDDEMKYLNLLSNIQIFKIKNEIVVVKAYD